MIVRAPVAPVHSHGFTGLWRDNRQEEFLPGSGRQQPVGQSTDFCFDGVCGFLCPVYQAYEKFPDHRTHQSTTCQELN